MSLYARLAAGVLIALAIAAAWWKVDHVLAAREQRGYDRRVSENVAADLQQSQINAKETQRRVERQQENQHAQDVELAAARRDAGRNAADAAGLHEQNADAVRRWRAALADPAAVDQRQAAGDAIGVLADVLSRADRRASILAGYADAARAAGIRCERDYDALTAPR